MRTRRRAVAAIGALVASLSASTVAAAAPGDGGAAPATAPARPLPLTVRVLELSRPLEAELEVESGQLRCDGVVLEGRKVSLRADGKAIAAGARRCERVSTDGDGVTLTLKELTRRYRGTVRVGTADFHLTFFNVLDVEDYLRGVVGAQMESGAPQALRAQTVVSRTFALASRGRHGAQGYDLCDLPHCLPYRGREAERPDADVAVAKTAGEVLRVGGVVLRPVYSHPVCGGATSSAAEEFGDETLPGGAASDAVAGAAPLCADAQDFVWSWRVDRPTLAAALGLKEDGAAFEVLRRDRAGRVLEARVFGRRQSASELWGRLERSPAVAALRSLKFTVTESESVVQFEGGGVGHGVGLCQGGARTAAGLGWDYRRILGLYFPLSAVRPLTAP